MTYSKELASLRAYINTFDPEEFSTSQQPNAPLLPTAESLAYAQRLKAKWRRNRQNAESLLSLLALETPCSEQMITQDEVDALLEGWTAPEQ